MIRKGEEGERRGKKGNVCLAPSSPFLPLPSLFLE
jgi:hypothetical protein